MLKDLRHGTHLAASNSGDGADVLWKCGSGEHRGIPRRKLAGASTQTLAIFNSSAQVARAQPKS